jgi:hypothetical protein
MIQGFDMFTPCTSATNAACLKRAGYTFAGRYYSIDSSKALTSTEAQLLCGAGLLIVSVYEDDGDGGSFSANLGTENAQTAVQQANAVGQPGGSAIYFAVDYDASEADLTANIEPYFRAVQSILQSHDYAIGVYGSGLVCSSILEAGLATYAWLSMSTAWRGSTTFKGWSIRQLSTTTICTLSVDTDQAMMRCGAFSVST